MSDVVACLMKCYSLVVRNAKTTYRNLSFQHCHHIPTAHLSWFPVSSSGTSPSWLSFLVGLPVDIRGTVYPWVLRATTPTILVSTGLLLGTGGFSVSPSPCWCPLHLWSVEVFTLPGLIHMESMWNPWNPSAIPCGISVCRSSSLDWKKDRNQTEPNCKRPDHRLRLHKF